MNTFNDDNTSGYTGEQLSALNSEWEKMVEQYGLEENTEAYEIMSCQFCDEVSRR